MQTITVFVDGKSYYGRFAVDGDQVTLESAHGHCVVAATDTSAVMIAVQSLRDMVIRLTDAAPAEPSLVPEVMPA
ncbi:MAG: hypothetical protein JO218_02520 [Burkholderiales bacterium]|nr:hypothetical protein [Burkholderiales bacterium]